MGITQPPNIVRKVFGKYSGLTVADIILPAAQKLMTFFTLLLFLYMFVCLSGEHVMPYGLSRTGDVVQENLLMRFHLSSQEDVPFNKTFILYTHNMKSGGTYLCKRALFHTNIAFHRGANCRFYGAYRLISRNVSIDEVDQYITNNRNITFVAIELTYNFWKGVGKHNFLREYALYSEAMMASATEGIWSSMVTIITVRDPLERYLSLLHELGLNHNKVNESTLELIKDHQLRIQPLVLYDNSLTRHLIPHGDKTERITENDFLVAMTVLDKYMFVLNLVDYFAESSMILSCVLNINLEDNGEHVRYTGTSKHLNNTDIKFSSQAENFFKGVNAYDYKILEYADSLLVDHYEKVKERCSPSRLALSH